MANLADLVVSITAQTKQFDKAIQDTKKKAEGVEKGIKKRKKMSNSIITIIILFISTFSFAQNSKPITLEQAITMAKENNMDLKIADKEIEKQTVLKKTAFQANPLQIEYMGGQYNSVDYDNNVSIQQYFPIGGSTKAKNSKHRS